MKWPSILIPLAFAAPVKSAEGLAEFLKGFASTSLSASAVEVLKTELVAGAKVPERAVESRHVVTFLHRVRNISRVYQLCVVENDADKSLRLSLGKPDYECRDELFASFAKMKGAALDENEKNSLQGYLWGESEPAVLELEQKLREYWK